MDLLQIRREFDKGKTVFDLPLRVAFYARVSTDKDEQLNSLHNQISHFEGYIKSQRKWEYAGGYIDEGLSGTSVNKRDDFLRMIDDARAGKFDFIITKEISRFSRSTLDSIQYTQELLRHNVGVLFQNDNINTFFNDAELRLTIMASIAQDEVRRLSERIKFGMKRAYESGKVLGNNNIYGYDKQDGRLTINEKEAEFIKALFTLYAEGQYGFRSLARILTEKGYQTMHGRELNPASLGSIIRNPKYKGFYCGHKTESNDYRQQKNVKLPVEEQVLYRDPQIPQIVSEELWDKANAVYDTKRSKFNKHEPGTQSRYRYSGKILCEEHGTYYYRKLWKDRKIPVESWCCKVYLAKGRAGCMAQHLQTTELDALLTKIGEHFIQNKQGIIQSLMNKYKQFDVNNVDYIKDISRLTEERDRQVAKKEKLLELSLDDTITQAEFITMNGRLNESLERISGELDKLKKAQQLANNQESAFADVRKLLEQKIDDSELPLDVAWRMLDHIVVHSDSAKDYLKLSIYMKYGDEVPAHIIKQSGPNNEETTTFISYIETEISPIVGSEKQSEELITYFNTQMEEDPAKLWSLNMFGKSMHDMVREGLQSKLGRMPEDAQFKLQETLQKIINEGNGGLICILL